MLKKLIPLLILLSITPAWADSELWLTATLQKSLKEGVSLNAIPEFRLRNSLSDLYYFRLYLGPSLKLNPNFTFNFYYAPNYVKSGNYWSSLGYMDLIYNLETSGLTFSNRARFENDLAAMVLKYRDQFLFSKNGWFVGDEVFYNLNRGYFDEERSIIGYAFNNFSLGYLFRRQKLSPSADWQISGAFNLSARMVL